MIKKILKFSFIYFFFTMILYAQNNPFNNQLPFQEGIIHYEVTGSEKGIETLYIKKQGQLQAQYRDTKSKVMSEATNNKTLKLTTHEFIYTIDLNSKTGKKVTNPKVYFMQRFKKLSKKEKKTVTKNIKLLGLNILQAKQSNIVKNSEEILGFTCDKSSIDGTTIYTISNTDIILKSEAEIMGFHTKTSAIKIDKVAVDDSLLKIPEDTTIEHNNKADLLQQDVVRNILNLLKDPNTSGKTNNEKKQINSKESPNPEEIHKIMKAGVPGL